MESVEWDEVGDAGATGIAGVEAATEEVSCRTGRNHQILSPQGTRGDTEEGGGPTFHSTRESPPHMCAPHNLKG